MLLTILRNWFSTLDFTRAMFQGLRFPTVMPSYLPCLDNIRLKQETKTITDYPYLLLGQGCSSCNAFLHSDSCLFRFQAYIISFTAIILHQEPCRLENIWFKFKKNFNLYFLEQPTLPCFKSQ